MPQTVTRTSGSQESPDSGQGGTAFDTVTSNSGSTAISIGSGSQTDTARWFNFSGVPTGITRILAKYDWSLGGTLDVSVDSNGTASADYSLDITPGSISRSDGISVNGPGPVSDHLDISDGGSVSTDISITTLISSIQFQASLAASAATTGTGTATAAPSCIISNIRLEITLADGTVQIMM